MTNDRTRAYERYLAAWSSIPDDERPALLRDSVSETVVFLNQVHIRQGRSDVAEHLQEFQAQMPGASFRLNNLVGWGEYALAEWQLVASDNNPGFSGYDMLTFGNDGLITNIIMVVNIEAQKIVWRRRDPVSLELTD